MLADTEQGATVLYAYAGQGHPFCVLHPHNSSCHSLLGYGKGCPGPC